MEKLRLDVETLQVDGFVTVAPEARREGTVQGYDATLITNCTLGDCTDVTSCGRPCQ